MTTTTTKKLFECVADTGHDAKGWNLTRSINMAEVRELIEGYCQRPELSRNLGRGTHEDGISFHAQVMTDKIFVRRSDWGADGVAGNTNYDKDGFRTPYSTTERTFKTLAGALAYLKREVEAFQEVRGW